MTKKVAKSGLFSSLFWSDCSYWDLRIDANGIISKIKFSVGKFWFGFAAFSGDVNHLREGFKKKSRKKSGVLPNRGGGGVTPNQTLFLKKEKNGFLKDFSVDFVFD